MLFMVLLYLLLEICSTHCCWCCSSTVCGVSLALAVSWLFLIDRPLWLCQGVFLLTLCLCQAKFLGENLASNFGRPFTLCGGKRIVSPNHIVVLDVLCSILCRSWCCDRNLRKSVEEVCWMSKKPRNDWMLAVDATPKLCCCCFESRDETVFLVWL